MFMENTGYFDFENCFYRMTNTLQYVIRQCDIVIFNDLAIMCSTAIIYMSYTIWNFRGHTLLDPEYTPWLKHYGKIPKHMDFPERTLYEMVKKTSEEYPDNVAYEFMDIETKYCVFIKQIDNFAACLSKKLGVKEGDHVLICLPNCPQAVISFYAVSKLGAVAVMIHPLSAKGEIEFYVENSDCKVAITLDMFYKNFPEFGGKFESMVVSSMADGLKFPKSTLYKYVLGRKDPKVDNSVEGIIKWKDLLATDVSGYDVPVSTKTCYDPAVILYTGGTTGRSKGAVLSSMSFNSTALGMVELSEVLNEGRLMMAVMPMFHGFGLCACVHLPFCIGITSVLVPRFTPDSYSKLIMKKHPHYVAGVPTLYEHMIRSKWLKKADLECLKGIFSGGDKMPVESKKRIDEFLKERGCKTFIREGYGCTECLTATTITPKHLDRPGSVGIPMPNVYYKIVKPGTEERVPYGEDGEMCVSAPAVMLEYYKEPEETANALRVHSDGLTWLHTGDLGYMDEDGFIFFKQRIKRMIISSGYNIYPSQVEEVLSQHPAVDGSCVVGIPDDLRGSKVKAYIVLKPGFDKSEETLKSIKAHVKENISKFSKPREYEFIDALPRTKVGKIDYRLLENKK